MRIRAPHIAAIAAVTLTAADALAKTELPQLDSSSFGNQLFWLGITFVTLYLIVRNMVVPNIASVLDSRAETIADAIAKAEAFKRHADEAKGGAEAGSQHARNRAAELLATAQADAAKHHADALAGLNATLATESDAAQATITKAVAAANTELEQAAAGLARTIAEKLLGSTVDEASVKAAISSKKAA